jgi:concanavalin A-like lectin/glucanase superfamily protein
MRIHAGIFRGLIIMSVANHPATALGGEASIRQAVLLYASFDEAVRADFGNGGRDFATRTGTPNDPNTYLFKKGFDATLFRSAPGKGAHGGALEVVDVLPNNGRIFLPVRGHLDFKKGGWGGAVSVWINTDPNEKLKTPFCDPIQITQKGANNGGIWVDFNNAKPKRDLRMGVFPAAAPGQKGISEDDPNAPMVRVPGISFRVGEWHHIVLSWQNFDTGKNDAHADLYIDAKHLGSVKDRAIAMDWDVDKAGIYVAVNFIGLLDELATFSRPLTQEEVALLYRRPGILASLKK